MNHSERMSRYIRRCYQRLKRETQEEIKKKNEEISRLSRENTDNINKYKRTLLMADLNFNSYQNLYVSYANTVKDADYLIGNLHRDNTNLREENARLSESLSRRVPLVKRSKTM